jgi:hypothetical protein
VMFPRSQSPGMREGFAQMKYTMLSNNTNEAKQRGQRKRENRKNNAGHTISPMKHLRCARYGSQGWTCVNKQSPLICSWQE